MQALGLLLRQVLVIEYGTRLFQWCRQSELLPFAAHRAAQEAAIAELGKKLTRAASYKRAMQANPSSLKPHPKLYKTFYCCCK